MKKFNESIDPGKLTQVETVVKLALENMYMFGGMPKPDPNYDNYIKKMSDAIMKEVKSL